MKPKNLTAWITGSNSDRAGVELASASSFARSHNREPQACQEAVMTARHLSLNHASFNQRSMTSSQTCFTI
jgi:hypothetical protein